VQVSWKSRLHRSDGGTKGDAAEGRELDLALNRIEIGNFPDYLLGTAIEASPNGRGVWERES
jgi:hypothetical protein